MYGSLGNLEKCMSNDSFDEPRRRALIRFAFLDTVTSSRTSERSDVNSGEIPAGGALETSQSILKAQRICLLLLNVFASLPVKYFSWIIFYFLYYVISVAPLTFLVFSICRV